MGEEDSGEDLDQEEYRSLGILQAHAVSFYLVRWVGVLSVIGQNKLTCDWLDWPVV
jgi:hypothetical protein